MVFVYPTQQLKLWTVVDVDLLSFDISKQHDQHVSSSNTLHQDLVKCGCGLVFILSNQQCGNRMLKDIRGINSWTVKSRKWRCVESYLTIVFRDISFF